MDCQLLGPSVPGRFASFLPMTRKGIVWNSGVSRILSGWYNHF